MPGHMGFSLQGNATLVEGAQHTDRDAQFTYLAAQAAEHLAAGQPVISVDTKKEELVGNFCNGGKEYQPAGTPERVNVHDFLDTDLGRAIPYGSYDVGANTAWVSVGTDHDTSAFSVATLRTWWEQIGQARAPDADRLICAANYPTGLRYAKKRVDALPLNAHDFHGEWNYTITPPDTP